MLWMLPLSLAAPDLTAMAVELEPAVAEARGWSFKAEVPKKVESVAELQTMLSSEAGSSAADLAMLRLMGLIPPNYDLDAAAKEVLSDQIGGFYDPKTRQLVLVDRNLEGSNFLTRMLLAHELGHALDDQYFDLQKLDDQAVGADAKDATRSLIEGSATVAMLTWMLHGIQQKTVTMADLTGAMSGSMQYDQRSFNRSPPWLRAGLLVPYVGGAAWLLSGHPLQDLMKPDLAWVGERVLRAAADPPSSTEQILHPEKYWTERDAPVVLTVSGLPAGSDALASSAPETVGELSCMSLVDPKGRFLKGLGFQHIPVLPACSGWGGDRLLLRDSGHAIWVSTWDTPLDREEFQKAWKTKAPRYPVGDRTLVYALGYTEPEMQAFQGQLQISAVRADESWSL